MVYKIALAFLNAVQGGPGVNSFREQTSRMRLALIAGGVVGALFVAGCGGDDDSDEPETLDPQQVIENATPATAGITGEQSGVPTGGSGVIFDQEQGLILTNAHVVEGLDKLEVKIGDDPTTVPARIRAVAPCDDLAVIEMIQQPAEVGELVISDSPVERGEHVTALGFPGNFQKFGEQTLQTTDGTVSNPDVVAQEIDPSLPTYQALIQHQVPINPGNSGGPLVNDEAEVVGINTLGDTTKENQLYSIDSTYVNDLLPDLVAGNDRLRMGWDLRPFATIDVAGELEFFLSDKLSKFGISPDEAAQFVADQNLPNGMYVFGTEPGLPAEKAAIIAGDLVTQIDGEPVNSLSDVCEILQSQEPGATVEVSGNYIASSRQLNDVGDAWTVDMKLPEEELEPPTEETTTTSETTTAE
jgi:S1-C subfamily serine protease